MDNELERMRTIFEKLNEKNKLIILDRAEEFLQEQEAQNDFDHSI